MGYNQIYILNKIQFKSKQIFGTVTNLHETRIIMSISSAAWLNNAENIHRLQSVHWKKWRDRQKVTYRADGLVNNIIRYYPLRIFFSILKIWVPIPSPRQNYISGRGARPPSLTIRSARPPSLTIRSARPPSLPSRGRSTP